MIHNKKGSLAVGVGVTSMILILAMISWAVFLRAPAVAQAVGGTGGSGTPQPLIAPGGTGGTLSFSNLELTPKSYSDPFVRTQNDCGLTATTTTLTYNVQNLLNTTTSTYDVASYFYPQSSGGAPIASTDSTAGSVSLKCGETYAIKIVAQDAAYGDNTKIDKIIAGNAVLESDGVVLYRPVGTVDTLTLGSTAHGTLQAKCYDLLGRASCFGTSGSTDIYRNTTATFRKTNNATGFAPGANGDLNIELTLRSRETAVVDNSDWGNSYVGIDLTRPASYTSNYTSEQIMFDGVNLNLATPTSVGDRQGMSTDELVYATPSKNYDDSKYANSLSNGQPYLAYSGWTFGGSSLHKLTVLLHTGAGAPSVANDVKVNVYGTGNYLSADGLHIFRNAFDDTQSHAAVFTKMQWVVDL